MTIMQLKGNVKCGLVKIPVDFEVNMAKVKFTVVIVSKTCFKFS